MNTSIRCIIIEDEKGPRTLLKSMLEEFCDNVKVIAEADNVDDGAIAIASHEPDIVFLDIEMPKKNGFELFDLFPNPKFKVIFTTAYSQYAIKAIRMAALDYLMKPINIEELQAALDRYAEQAQDKEQLTAQRLQLMQQSLKHNSDQIAIPISDGYQFISVNDIIRCASHKGYTTIVLNNGTELFTSRGLSDYTQILESFGFMRIHRSHLINPKYIKRFLRGKSATVYMADDAEIIVSNSKKESLLQQFVKV